LTFHDDETIKTCEGILPNLPGFTATVNMSWFIVKTHLANLLYITERDYEAVIAICNDIMNVYNESMLHKWFADILLPASLSTQWTAVYDSDIQQLLGFYVLSLFVLNRNGCHDVHLGICPVQYSIYLKIRCMIDQHRW